MVQMKQISENRTFFKSKVGKHIPNVPDKTNFFCFLIITVNPVLSTGTESSLMSQIESFMLEFVV